MHESERRLRRYIEEVVEHFGLCPWARRARERDELAIEVLDGAALPAVLDAITRILARPGVVMGMVIVRAPAAPLDPRALRRLRDEVVAARAGVEPAIGVADFHPDPALDLSSPARAIAGLRRAPEPTLQIVRLDVLAAARATPPTPDRAEQAAALAGRAEPPAPPVSDQIAADNLATARDRTDELEAAIEAVRATEPSPGRP